HALSSAVPPDRCSSACRPCKSLPLRRSGLSGSPVAGCTVTPVKQTLMHSLGDADFDFFRSLFHRHRREKIRTMMRKSFMWQDKKGCNSASVEYVLQDIFRILAH
ncbi:hypothetical protein, partial [Shigella flexneri]|uniref:hypothetical protein n=1 Tax=Shigella flexneri TaxID=623 RepID=UPI0020967202